MAIVHTRKPHRGLSQTSQTVCRASSARGCDDVIYVTSRGARGSVIMRRFTGSFSGAVLHS
eukprot:4382748-Pleurochrysis_carterae.AAC.1